MIVAPKFLLLPIAVLAATPHICAADVVQLDARDGSSSIIGHLRSYSDERYQLDTALGHLLVHRRLVSCQGAACPDIGLQTDAEQAPAMAPGEFCPSQLSG